MEEIEKYPDAICAAKNVETIKNHYSNVTDETGAFNIPKMWGIFNV